MWLFPARLELLVLPEQIVQCYSKCFANGDAQVYRGVVVTFLYRVDCLAADVYGFRQIFLRHIFKRAGRL